MGNAESQATKESDDAHHLPDRQINREELAKHTKKDDCWIAISGAVYDVSQYIDKHPGGPANLLHHAGADGTRSFKDIGARSKFCALCLP
jgi:cytochrome b involved in lipid metabolism